ncbi:MAG: radical SAM protein [Candidatus Margulisiibacteriota bacterium]
MAYITTHVRPLKKPSVVLVTSSGYPTSIANFMPDNGLATLAAILNRAGIRVKIMDFNTVDQMRKYVPPILQGKIEDAYKTILEVMQEKKPSPKQKARLMMAGMKLRGIEKILNIVRWQEEKNIAEKITSVVRAEEATLVGFKTFHGPGFSGPVHIAKELRGRFPDLLIAAGGPQVNTYREHIPGLSLDDGVFDVLCIKDGEPAIVPLAEASVGRSLLEVPNAFVRDRGTNGFNYTQDAFVGKMSDIPFPTYDPGIYLEMEGDGKIRVVVIEDGRGCGQGCRFCIHGFAAGRQRREKSPARVADEFQNNINEYGINTARFGGSTSPGKYLREFAEEVIRRTMKINWSSFARLDIDPTILPTLRESGLIALFFGIESANQIELDAMNKNIAIGKAEEIVSACRGEGIFSVGSFIYPAPFSTASTIEMNMAFIRKTGMQSALCNPVGVFRGTDYAENPEENGIRMRYPSGIKNFLASIGLIGPAYYEHPDLIQYLAKYEIRRLVPPKNWDALPWQVYYNNQWRGFKDYIAETQTLFQRLRQEGIPMLTDEEALMARKGGYSFAEFAMLSRKNILNGNAEATQDMVVRINKG